MCYCTYFVEVFLSFTSFKPYVTECRIMRVCVRICESFIELPNIACLDCRTPALKERAAHVQHTCVWTVVDVLDVFNHLLRAALVTGREGVVPRFEEVCARVGRGMRRNFCELTADDIAEVVKVEVVSIITFTTS